MADEAAPPRKARKTTRETPMRQRGVNDASARSRMQSDSDVQSATKVMGLFSGFSFSRRSQPKTALKTSDPSVPSSGSRRSCTRWRAPVSHQPPPQNIPSPAPAG